MSTEPHPNPPFPERQRQSGHSLARFLTSIILSLSAACAAAALIPPAVHWPAWAAGWLTSALNAVIGHVLHAKAVDMSINRFLVWGIAGNCLRMLFLFASICTFSFLAQGPVRRSFLASFLTGLFVFMGSEILTLVDISSPKDSDGPPAKRQ